MVYGCYGPSLYKYDMMDIKLLLQIIGVALGLLYLYLEYRANIWLWVVGLIMPVVHGMLYYRSGLYADCAMEVYYILAGVYGLSVWLRRGGKDKESKFAISHATTRVLVTAAGIYAVAHVVIYYLLVNFTDSTVPVWDSFTTACSVVAYWLLSRKYVEQWLVWLVVDVVTVGLYFYKDIPLTAMLYAVYSALAVVGYMRWRRMARQAE